MNSNERIYFYPVEETIDENCMQFIKKEMPIKSQSIFVGYGKKIRERPENIE
ncbi:MAG: hypothetical protein ACTSWX_04200 [Promethearchaeota archaeon]